MKSRHFSMSYNLLASLENYFQMFIYTQIHSAVPHPDLFWYFLNGMGTQKKFSTFLSCYVKTKDTDTLTQGHQILNNFGPTIATMKEFHVLLNYPYTNIKKMACPENIWI